MVSLGGFFYARGQVHRIADHGTVHAVDAAYRADHHHAGIQADADVDGFIARTNTSGVVIPQAFQHGDGAAHRLVGACFEQGHDGIADIFVDDAVMAADDRFHLAQVGVDELESFRRGHGFRQRGEIPDVREHDGHLAFDLVAQLHVDDAFCLEQIEQLMRNQSAVRRFGLL